MATDTIVTLSVIGVILLLNIISLICVYCTAYGKSLIYSTMRTESKGYFIFWNFWMLLTGFTFWMATAYQFIRYGKSDYSEWNDVTVKELMAMLEEEWAKKKE